MKDEYHEKQKWDIVFEHQRIRNHHEANYWKIILENQRKYKMKERILFIVALVLFILLFYLLCDIFNTFGL